MSDNTFKIFDQGNITLLTTSGEVKKVSTIDYWTNYLSELYGNNTHITLVLCDKHGNEKERRVVAQDRSIKEVTK